MQVSGVENITPESPKVRESLSRLRRAAAQVTGSLFYGTLLRSMRESEMKGPYGHGGRGEEIFAEQLHGILAERLGEATKSDLGQMIYRHLEGQQRRLAMQRSAVMDQNA